MVRFSLALVHGAASHVHFTPDDGFEQFGLGLGYLCPAGCDLSFGILAGEFAVFDFGYSFFLFLDFPLGAAVLLVDIVGKLFDAEHVSMVGHGNAFHAVLHGFVDQLADAGLSVQKGILGMDMQMNKILHKLNFLSIQCIKLQ